MALNIFLFFPETENQILNDNLKQIVNSFFQISKKIKDQGDINLFYDSNNISSFLDLNEIAEIYLESEVNKLRIKLQKTGAKDILINKKVDDNSFYFQWNFDNFSVENCFEILKEIAERKTEYKLEKFLLINFNNSIAHCRERILVFKDTKYINDFPKNFIHIDFVSDFFEFEIWLNTNQGRKFSLLNKIKFLRTSFVQQGKPVFKDVENGNFWYIDNFHKNEYEVFNSQRIHIGVANLEGILDITKAVSGRTF